MFPLAAASQNLRPQTWTSCCAGQMRKVKVSAWPCIAVARGGLTQELRAVDVTASIFSIFCAGQSIKLYPCFRCRARWLVKAQVGQERLLVLYSSRHAATAPLVRNQGGMPVSTTLHMEGLAESILQNAARSGLRDVNVNHTNSYSCSRPTKSPN